MRSHRWKSRPWACVTAGVCATAGLPGRATLILLLMALFAAPAQAHRLHLWAAVAEGHTINGRAYFSGGGGARHLTVRILDGEGRLLAEVRTDDKGDFTFAAQVRCDHQFVAASPDGHRDSFTIPAAQLPDDLPSLPNTTPHVEAPAAPADAEDTAATSNEVKLQRLIDSAVARHTMPLRRQLQAYEDKVRLHDILGGIGYIVGLTGIGFYLLGRRRRA